MQILTDTCKMHIEDIFEDLEAQFAATLQESQRKSFFEDSNLVVLQTLDKQIVELVTPVLGSDFISGLSPSDSVWHFYLLNSVAKINFKKLASQEFPPTRATDASLGSFIEGIKTPCPIRWKLIGSDFQNAATLQSAQNGLLEVCSKLDPKPFFVPISATSQISIQIVDNPSDKI